MQSFRVKRQVENEHTIKDVLESHVSVYAKSIRDGTNPIWSECPFRVDVRRLQNVYMCKDPDGRAGSPFRLHHPYQEGVDTGRSLYAPAASYPFGIPHTLQRVSVSSPSLSTSPMPNLH